MERVPWYVSRRPLAASVRSKEVRIYLSPEHWEVFDRECERLECYRGRLASAILTAVLKGVREPEVLEEQVRLGLRELAREEVWSKR